MLKLADLIEGNAARLGHLESIAIGQPLGVSTAMAGVVASYLRYYAGYADKIPGKVFPDEDDGRYKIVQYSPLGVCAGLASWNFTLMNVAWKIAPAIAAGNTFIFKSSEKSPLGALALGELVIEAGFPPGVINFVSGPGSTGALLASHMKIAKVALTGSVLTGRRVQDAATKSNLKKVCLELGGKSASLIFDDADLESALMDSSAAFLFNSGQVCAALSRVFVHEKIAPAFIEGLKTLFQSFVHGLGDPLDKETKLGPLADRAQFERVMSFITEGKKQGLNFAAGGSRKGEKGYFLEPTLIVDPPVSSRVYTDEIFGPVLVVKTFKTEEEAIELANDTSYGLAGMPSSPPLSLTPTGTAMRDN
jgi:aldehyde dehydrogenase (NAD+)